MRRWAKDEHNPSSVASGKYKPVLSYSEEEMLVNALEESFRRGWLCGPEEVKPVVQSYLNKLGKKTVLKDNLPGEDWMMAFKKSFSYPNIFADVYSQSYLLVAEMDAALIQQVKKILFRKSSKENY